MNQESSIQQTIHEMEQAASILMNPLNGSRDLLKISENIFLTFSKQKLNVLQVSIIKVCTFHSMLNLSSCPSFSVFTSLRTQELNSFCSRQ